MKVDWMTGLWLLGLVACVAAVASGLQEDDSDKEVRKQELYLLANLLHPAKSAHSRSAADLDGKKKRQQGSWDMDYGWGGGRFGKRGDMLDYGWGGGRFGKRADMLDYGWGGGRFGKRSSDMLDYGWGGGRFGKRSGIDKKLYDAYARDSRYGRDVDHVDTADDQE